MRQLFIAFAALLIGCETGSGQHDSFCDAFCERGVQCVAGGSYDVCKSNCDADPPVMRADLLTAVGECAFASSCETLISGEYWKTCVDQVEARGVQPVEDTVHFCEALAPAVFECGSFYGESECADGYKWWPPEVLVDAESCTREARCEDFDTCMTGVFDNL